ncbi:o-succinylbenzoate synthase [Aldersonia sp. NBC_00410]|uniref:o-succinylbenzoate synthase n=1 Tax=Aldersonia sp. NBC_00410 TaxID=2975954 RepID=UPI0022564156|nr:o-succinylbenzoate synthase [Aldersonia sp. NBC_00410]MCX5041732.1 o-succinylbenzoate synthase [Aldersonia sp. NBC_00410]
MLDLPPLSEVLADLHVLRLPMRVRFRGITTREVALLRGPAGWGEFSPFLEYDTAESANWLRSAIESAWLGPPTPLRDAVPVNATVPAVGAERVPEILDRFPGADTAKVKVAEPGQTLADDVARVEAVRALLPNVRVDANGGWTVEQAVRALRALTVSGPLQYAEQPCATVDELVELRRRVPEVPIAADESIRRATDPLRVARAGGLDVAVVKVAPLGGMRATVALAGQLRELGADLVVSSALDSAVGMAAGVAAAAALPNLSLACGLGTGGFFETDVVPVGGMNAGVVPVDSVEPDPDLLTRLAAPRDRRVWWTQRVSDCYFLVNYG